MNSPRYARLIADVFKRGEPRSTELSSRSNRDEEIALIERAIDRLRRRNARLRTAAKWLVAAGFVLGGFGAWRTAREKATSASPLAHMPDAKAVTTVEQPVAIAIASGGGAIVAAPGSSVPARGARALQAGSRLIVDPNAGAKLSLSTGTQLEVEPGSQLSVVEDNRVQIFALTAGSMRADVAKLAKDERFLVRTTDAEVEVRGTSFLVGVVAADPSCGDGTTTRVTVFEGVVTVRAGGREEAVGRGDHWPHACRKSAARPPSVPAPPHAAAKHPAKIEAPASVPTPVPAAPLAAADTPPSAAPVSHGSATHHPPASTLTEENNLFADGMLARRSGNVLLAIEKMDRFLERYPTSHLAENAAAERMRLLRTLDPARAAAAARQYLQRYPTGFARGDGEAILAGMR